LGRRLTLPVASFSHPEGGLSRFFDGPMTSPLVQTCFPECILQDSEQKVQSGRSGTLQLMQLWSYTGFKEELFALGCNRMARFWLM